MIGLSTASRKRWLTYLGYVVSFATLLALWQALSSRAVIALLFPSPVSTFRAAVELWRNGQLGVDVEASLTRIALGFLFGSVLGIALGLLMGSFRVVRLVFEPYVQFFRFLPALAWIPAAMVWLGTGEVSKVALLVYTTVFVVAINTMFGVSAVSRNQLRAAQSFGATPWQQFLMVKIPSTVSYMLTGMRLAMGNCFATIVAAELLAANAGIGYLIFSARTWMQTQLAFVGILALGTLGFLVDLAFRFCTDRLCRRFLPPEAT